MMNGAGLSPADLRRREWLVVAGVLLLLAAVTPLWTSPFSLHLADGAKDQVDSLLNCWILAWDHHWLAGGGGRLFDANIFYPVKNTLAFSEHLMGQALLSWPLRLVTANPVLIHNLLLMASFPLSGLAMFLLVRRLTGSAWAGLAAGFFFAFCPYRVSQSGHVQTMSVQWAVFAFWFLHRYLDSRSWGDLAGMALCYWLQCLSGSYLALFLTLTLGLALVVPLLRRGDWCNRRTLAQLAAFGLASLAVLLPFFLPYVQLKRQMGFTRPLYEVVLYSADLLDYLNGVGPLPWREWLAGLYHPHAVLFPGLLSAGLVVAGLWPGKRERGPAAGAAWLYGALALLCLLLSLGPVVKAGGRELGPGPYLWLYRYVPGFEGLRAVSRWGLFYSLFLAVLLGLGAARVLERLPRRGWRLAGLALLLVVMAWEMYPGPMRWARARSPQRLPAAVTWLAEQKTPGAVLNLPVGGERLEVDYLYLSIFDQFRPIMNGHSGYFPPGFDLLRDTSAMPPSRLLAAQLQRMGVRWVVLWLENYRQPEEGRLLLSRWRALAGLVEPVVSFRGQRVLRLLPAVEEPLLWAPSRGGLLAGAQASVNDRQARLALDGELATRWSSGRAQRPGTWFQARLKKPLRVAGLDLCLGSSWHDYPRGLAVSLELADGTWTPPRPLWGCPFPLRGILARPRQASPAWRVMLPRPRRIRGFRLVQTGRHERYFWSIHELRLIPAPDQ